DARRRDGLRADGRWVVRDQVVHHERARLGARCHAGRYAVREREPHGSVRPCERVRPRLEHRRHSRFLIAIRRTLVVVRVPTVLVIFAACGRGNFELDADVDTSGSATHNIAFVTSTTAVPMTFGSDLAGADKMCMDRASAGGLPGTYVAYLS